MHGNFAAAIQVRQEALQNILLILHRGGELPREFNGPTTIPDINPTGAGSSVLHHTWFLDVPQVTFDPAVSNLAQLSFRLAGPLSIQAEGVDLTTRQVRLTLTIGALFQGTIVQVPQPPPETLMGAFFAPDPTFDLRVTFTPVIVLASKLRVVGWSTPLPAAWIDFFESPTFRFGLGMLMANQLTNVQSVLPANLAPILGALRIGNGSTVSLTGIVGDKCATIGIDVANPLHGIATAGDPAAVDNFLGGADIALIVDEGIHSLLGRAARTEINKRQGSVDVTSLTIAFRPGHFRVSGHGEADAGSADFSFHLTPRLGKPEQIEWYDDEYGGQYSEVVALASDEIWLDLSNLEVDENLAWWVILGLGLGGLVLAWFGPPGPAVLGQIVHSVLLEARVKLVTKVEGTNTDLARRWEGTLPGTDVPNIKFKIESIQVFNDRVETRLTLTPEWPAEGTIAGPGSVSIEQIQSWQTFTLQAPFRNYDLADPEIRVRWQLRRSDTNEVVAEATHPPGTDHNTSHFFFARFSPYGVGHSGLSTFTLSVRVYRGLGGPSFDYLNTTRTIHISDSLDRSHPYVHWHHNIPTPEVVNGKQICGGNCPAGWRQNSRHSKIHRTDFPGRCRFAGRYSTSVQQLDYLDDLPFPLADLDANRDQVCDYCFYGGPTRTEKKIGARKIKFQPL